MKPNLKYQLLAALGLLAILLISPVYLPDPYMQDLNNALIAPNMMHLGGTDRYGRDVLARVIAGAKVTVISAFLLLLLLTIVGTFLGLLAGFKGGRLDNVFMRLTDIFLAFPEMVLAIAVAGVLGGGIYAAMLAVGIIGWTRYARLARSLVMALKNEPYIAEAKMSGTNTFKIIQEHILPNIAGPILVTAALHSGTLIMELAGLSFLGLGVMPPAAELGAMLNDGHSVLQQAPWLILAPGMAIFIIVAMTNSTADAMRDYFDKRSS